MKRSDYLILLYLVSLMLIISLGTYDRVDFVIEPEYTAGILGASSILFGFWFVMLERKPEGIRREIIHKHYLRYVLLMCLVFLASSVVTVFLSALNKLPSIAALIICFINFFNILFLVVFTLWEFTFKY